jgi:hypothetical protein
MTTDQVPEQQPAVNNRTTLTFNPDELLLEARAGLTLAKALVKHTSRMRASGYDNEVLVDGEVWTVTARRKSPVA